MKRISAIGLAMGLALSLAWPVHAAPPQAPQKQRTKITVYPAKKKSPYGFLPGYRQPPALTDWRAQNRLSAMHAYQDARYGYVYGPYGMYRYDWAPGSTYPRDRWPGATFGSCWGGYRRCW